jgi:poly-gamma-glutamate synthesis protein (capsule biosynthesis protein)
VGAAGAAGRPHIVFVTRRGIRVALLAFDASTEGARPAQAVRGAARWRPEVARAEVLSARRRADLVTVALHGGLAYQPSTDPHLWRLAVRLARWGADVVWCSGPHAIQPIAAIDPDHDGRATVVATSLGNLLFDGGRLGPPRGALLEVLATRDGVTAFRAGTTSYGAGRAMFLRWLPPQRRRLDIAGGVWTGVSA